MFKTHKQYENGGKVLIHDLVDRKAIDYGALKTIANQFAKDGKFSMNMKVIYPLLKKRKYPS